MKGLSRCLPWALLSAVVMAPEPGRAEDVVRGRLLYLQCAACHATSDGGPELAGPHLAGIVGRPAASVPGYAYSDALAKSSIVWDRTALDRWLANPARYLPENKMAFLGISDAGSRAAIIDYLETLKGED